MPLPTPRAALLLALASLPALLGAGQPGALALGAALDLALLALVALDARLAPGPGALEARRTLRVPLSAFAPNRVVLSLQSRSRRPLQLQLADAPPPELDTDGHRRALQLPPGGSAELAYQATPRRRGQVRFGDLHVRARGPLGLAARGSGGWRWRARWPSTRTCAAWRWPRGRQPRGRPVAPPRPPRGSRVRGAAPAYLPGDDVRAIDWKATARRGGPVVREWQPERNQTVWLLLDCGRHLPPGCRMGGPPWTTRWTRPWRWPGLRRRGATGPARCSSAPRWSGWCRPAAGGRPWPRWPRRSTRPRRGWRPRIRPRRWTPWRRGSGGARWW
ncbi:MAG: DUF58 domain-containing protein [Anaeromyxobacter sp.]